MNAVETASVGDSFGRGGFMGRTWVLLFVAIAMEIFAATAMKLSADFTDVPWALATIVAYAASFLMLSRVLMRLPIGLTYGLWGGIGTVTTAVIGMVLWGDPFNWLLGVGMVLIIAGIAELARGFALADKQAAVEQISPQRD